MTAKLPRCQPAKLFRQSATVADGSCQAVKLPLLQLLRSCTTKLASCQTAKLSSYLVQQPNCNCCTSKLSNCQAAAAAHPSCQAVKRFYQSCKAGLPNNQAVHLLPAHLVILFLVKPLFPLPLPLATAPPAARCCFLLLLLFWLMPFPFAAVASSFTAASCSCSTAAADAAVAVPLLLHCCWCCCCRCLLLHCCLLLLPLPPAAVSHSALVYFSWAVMSCKILFAIHCNTKSIIFVIVITIPCKTIRKKKNDNTKKGHAKGLRVFLPPHVVTL